MGIFDRIKAEIALGTVIYRKWTVQEVRKLKTPPGEFALIYWMPGGHKNPKGHKRNIKESEWNKAYNQLMTAGCFRLSWFKANMRANIGKCNRGGNCNFHAIGGVFCVMGIANFAGKYKGMYLKITQIP